MIEWLITIGPPHARERDALLDEVAAVTREHEVDEVVRIVGIEVVGNHRKSPIPPFVTGCSVSQVIVPSRGDSTIPRSSDVAPASSETTAPIWGQYRQPCGQDVATSS